MKSWSNVGKIEMMCVFTIAATMFGLEAWKRFEKNNFNGWTFFFAVIFLAATIFFTRLLYIVLFPQHNIEKSP